MSSIATVEIRSFSGPDLVELDGVNRPAIIRLNVGPAGTPGPNSVTSATTSDATCELSLESLQVGQSSVVTGSAAAAIGESTASASYSFAAGYQNTASGGASMAIGSGTTASGLYSFAGGLGSTSSGDLSFAFGGATASGTAAFAFGDGAMASGDASYAFGTDANAVHQGASVETDSQTGTVTSSTTTDEKTFRFANGYRFLGGSATFEGTLFANHIHGNIAGNVYTHVRAGEALTKGDPVYVSGSHGSGSTLIPIVSKADASNAAKMPAVGIVDADIANNANGHMVIVGTITELNTDAYAINDTLYVATGGGFTATPPAANSQPVARVERSNANNGAVIVKVNGLASTGGNGASDANKLVRFSSTGGISQTGGTMTDTTYAGTASFTSTTRPTSAGTGTPAATSLITRDDGDTRYGAIVSMVLGSDATITSATFANVTGASASLEANSDYSFDGFIHVEALSALSRVQCRLGYTGTLKSVQGMISCPQANGQTFAMVSGSLLTTSFADTSSVDRVFSVTGFIRTNTSGTVNLTAYRVSGTGSPQIKAGSQIRFTKLS